MKIVKLSRSQTTVLANLGVNVTADVLVPAGKSAGSYTFCTYCYWQRFEAVGDDVQKICANETIEVGLGTVDCFYNAGPVTAKNVAEVDYETSDAATNNELMCTSCFATVDKDGACNCPPREADSDSSEGDGDGDEPPHKGY